MKGRQTRFLIVLGALLLIALLTVGACSVSERAPGQIELSATVFDLGTVPNNEPVSRVFQVRNVGPGALDITGVSTSCGCTTAEVGSRSLRPGEAADLTVTYDPQVHEGEIGTFLRFVYVRSNDPETPEASLALRVTVVNPEEAG